MKIVGLLMALVGWLIPLLALSMTQSGAARLAAALIGIIISLVGILGVLNKAHQEDAVWKKG